MTELVVCSKEDLAALIKAAVAEALSARVEVEYLTRKQVAELLGCSERAIRARIKEGLPAEKLGNEWRFERARVVEFMRRSQAA